MSHRHEALLHTVTVLHTIQDANDGKGQKYDQSSSVMITVLLNAKF